MVENNTVYTYNGKNATIEFKMPYDHLEWADGSCADYQDTVERVNPQIIKWYHGMGGSYQGDWWSAGYDANGNWFQKQGSFGTCALCDELEGCDTPELAMGFLEEMERLDPIGGSALEALIYLEKEKANTYSDAIEAIDEVMKGIKEYCEEMACVKEAVDEMMEKVKSGEIKTHRYTLEEFEKEFGLDKDDNGE